MQAGAFNVYTRLSRPARICSWGQSAEQTTTLVHEFVG